MKICYKKQNGCHNCKHAFDYIDYEEGYTYYCNSDNSERPLCGSVSLDESFYRHAFEENGISKEVSEEETEKKRKVVNNHLVYYFDTDYLFKDKTNINKIKDKIAKLSNREKKIIFLNFYEDKKHKDIGKIMNISRSNVTQIISRTLKKIRNNI